MMLNNLNVTEKFVLDIFGKDTLTKFKNIHKGGKNNQKGLLYESYFALYRIFELASCFPDWDNHYISTQNAEFVDDFCYQNLHKQEKYNYQLKNSESTSLWDSEFEWRFTHQKRLDIEHHKVRKSSSTLVVSSEDNHKKNLEKIPQGCKEDYFSEYFPYDENFIDLVRRLQPFVQKLTESDKLSDSDYVCKLMLGIWQSTGRGTITELIEKAGSEGNPNPFIKRSIDVIPDWLNKFEQLSYTLKGERLVITYNGLDVSIPLEKLADLSDEIENIANTQALFSLLFKSAAETLN